ncbi:hypothetical protein HD806DRAFT_412424 [Xylariaceae sp. AK1471]|nr:hypothetical protein HD806DRAFT_412424 [Xylariaceae sp. AK1471]
MAGIVIVQLSTLIGDLNGWITGLNDLSCTNDELTQLDALAGRLADVAAVIQKKTGSFKSSREEQAWKASEAQRSHATSTITDLISNGKLNRPAVFGRNIITIFTGPKDSVLDSEEMKSRKAATRVRCDRIRKLSADGIVAWAASYRPTAWAAGTMGKDIFDCLIDDIEPKLAQSWPLVVHQILEKLRNDESLQQSVEYGQFITALNSPTRPCHERLVKRRRANSENQTESLREHIRRWHNTRPRIVNLPPSFISAF